MSLYQLVELDTRGTLLETPVEAELQEVIHTTKGRGLSLSQLLEERRRNPEIDETVQTGRESSKLGVKAKSKMIERKGISE